MPVLTQTVHHSSGTFVAGTELAKTHELYRSAPHLFEDDDPVETATAAPGEKRSTRKPKS